MEGSLCRRSPSSPCADTHALLEMEHTTLRGIVQHLRAALPWEGCGLLATVDTDDARLAVRYFPGDNIDRSATRFTMDPRQVMAAMDEIGRNGWRLGAIVHSHPSTPPAPSFTDLQEAYYPDAWLVIVSMSIAGPEMRAWDIASRDEGILPCEVPIRLLPG